MAEKVTMWRADGRLFDSEAEAINHERDQDLITQITEFLHDREINHMEAASVARIMVENSVWFRTVLDRGTG